MPDDVPRDMRHLSKQFPGLRTFIPSNPREGGRCSLYAASERPRPCRDQHRLILHTNDPGGREVQPAAACRPVLGLGPERHGGLMHEARASSAGEGGPRCRVPGRAVPDDRDPEGGPGSRGRGSAVLDGRAPGSAVPDGAVPGWHSADSTVQMAAGRKQRAAMQRPQKPWAPKHDRKAQAPQSTGPTKHGAHKAQGPHGSRGVLQSPTETGTPRGTCGPFDAIPSGLRRTPR